MQTTTEQTKADGRTPVLFALAGLLFAVYPALRPYSDETALSGAEAMASAAWAAAHLAAVLAFILIPLALLGLKSTLAGTPGEGQAGAAFITSWVGIGLLLPYYGGETFGIQAISAGAVERADATLLTLNESVRMDAVPASVFGLGVILLAVAGVLTALAVGRSNVLPGWAGWPFAVALLLFLPQFFLDPAVRIGHGVLVGIGALVLAWALRKR